MNKLILVSVCVAVAAASNATYMKLTGLGRGQTIGIKYNGVTKNVFSGELMFRNESTSSNFTTMCIDLDHSISVGNRWHFAVSNSQDASSLKKKAGNVFANGFSLINSNNDAAALQIAVWSARYALNLDTNSTSSLGFRLDNTWYANNQATVNKAKNFLAAMNVNQNALIYTPIPTSAGQEQVGVVPEPATMIVLGAGAAALLRRRKKA